MDAAWIALIGTLMGGAGLKFIEKFLARGTEKQDFATKMRDELRTDLNTTKEEVRQLEKEIDQWKEKYFLLLQEHLEVRSQVTHQRPVKPEDKEVDW